MAAMGSDRLTERQRRFVLAYASNGQNGTAAARDAGYSGNDAALSQAGSRLLKVAKVQDALAGLVGKAIAKADRRAIASLAECLAFNTTVMRSRLTDYLTAGEVDYEKLKDAPAGLLRKLRVSTTTNEEGQVFTRTDIETESALAASQNLIKHYQDKDDGDRAEGALLAALRELPPESVRLIVRRMLAGPAPIDVPARLLP